MKNKKRMLLVGITVLVVVFVIIGVLIHKNKGNDWNSAETGFAAQTEEEWSQLSEEAISDSHKETKSSKKETIDTENSESKDSNRDAQDNENEKVDLSSEENQVYIDLDTIQNAIGESDAKKEEKKEITFPYTIPNTNLVVSKLSDYTGIYVENGENANVKSVCAMLITNKGDTAVEYAEITVKGASEEFFFSVATLPAGASAVIQEANKAAYQTFKPMSIQAECAELEALEMSEKQVKVEETEDGGLCITNLTDQDIPCVRVFYKLYMPEEDVYVGGITYVSKITNLKANASYEVNAKHYMAGNSKIMMVRTYDAV